MASNFSTGRAQSTNFARNDCWIPVFLPNDWEVAEIKKLKNKALQDDGGLRALHIFPCLQASVRYVMNIYCI